VQNTSQLAAQSVGAPHNIHFPPTSGAPPNIGTFTVISPLQPLHSVSMPFGSLLKKKKTKDSSSGQGATSPTKDTSGTLSPVSSKQSGPPQSTTTAATSVATPPSSTNGPVETKTDSTPKTAENTPSSGNPASAANMEKTAPRQTKGKYTLTDFTIERTLGTGSFGRVHLVQSKHNQRYYAVKVLKKQQVVRMKQIEHTNDERKMLQRVKHPFCITLWGTFQDSKNLYMVMDFIEGGELFSLLRKSQVCQT
jgi:protein kinase A